MLAELWRRRYLRPREQTVIESNGTIHVKKTVDAEPIMDAMKAYGDFIDRYSSRKLSQRMIGSLDPLTAANWARESGLKIGTRAFAQFAMNRIKNDLNYRRFKVGG